MRCSYHVGGWTSFPTFNSPLYLFFFFPVRDLFISFAHAFTGLSSEICPCSFMISGDSPFAEQHAFFPGFHLFFFTLCTFPLFVWHAQAANIFVCLFLLLLAHLSICYFLACNWEGFSHSKIVKEFSHIFSGYFCGWLVGWLVGWFTCKCLIHSEFILVDPVMYGSSSILFPAGCPGNLDTTYQLVTGFGRQPFSYMKYIYILLKLFLWSICIYTNTMKCLIIQVL